MEGKSGRKKPRSDKKYSVWQIILVALVALLSMMAVLYWIGRDEGKKDVPDVVGKKGGHSYETKAWVIKGPVMGNGVS